MDLQNLFLSVSQFASQIFSLSFCEEIIKENRNEDFDLKKSCILGICITIEGFWIKDYCEIEDCRLGYFIKFYKNLSVLVVLVHNLKAQ